MSHFLVIAVTFQLVCSWLGAFCLGLNGFGFSDLLSDFPSTHSHFIRWKIPSVPASGSLSLFICLLSPLFTPSARQIHQFSNRDLVPFSSSVKSVHSTSQLTLQPNTHPQPYFRLFADNEHVFFLSSPSSISRASLALISTTRTPSVAQLFCNNSGDTRFSKFTISTFPACILATFARISSLIADAFQLINPLPFGDRICTRSSHRSFLSADRTSSTFGPRLAINKHNLPAKGECNSIDLGSFFLSLLQEIKPPRDKAPLPFSSLFWVPISTHFRQRSIDHESQQGLTVFPSSLHCS